MKKDAVINELSGRNWINMNTSSPSQNLTRKVAERCHNFASTLSVHLVKQVILESLIPRRCGIIIQSVRCLHLQFNQIAGRPFIKKMLTKLISVPKEIFSFTKLMFRVVFSIFSDHMSFIVGSLKRSVATQAWILRPSQLPLSMMRDEEKISL